MPTSAAEYAGTAAAGTAASLVITPVMTVLDMAIIRAQLAKETLGTAVKATAGDLITGKAKWNPAFNIMWGVYAATYITANVTGKVCKDQNVDPLIPVALATSFVNSVTIALKDRAYAKLFTGSPKNFPAVSLGLFGLRDGLTISATFVVKDKVRDWMVDEKKIDTRIANVTAAFGVPMFAQIFSTPFHVLALDMFERPVATASERTALIIKNFGSVTSGRVLRIIPAFGFGGYLNDVLKDYSDEVVGTVPVHEKQAVGSRLIRRTSVV